MAGRRSVDDLSLDELEQILAVRRRELRIRRLRHMADEGRLVMDGSVAATALPVGLETPIRPTDTPPPSPASPTDSSRKLESPADPDKQAAARTVNLRWVANRLLLIVEILAVMGLLYITWDTWQTRQLLNREIQQAHKAMALENNPTPVPTPLIGVVLLPGGHTSPISETGAKPGEAGGIPEHLLPLVAAYAPPPIPTPAPEQARWIVIPAADVDHPIVQGDDWEQLKKGVGQHVGSANPGTAGNLILTAHNDIYGDIFRHLDRMETGDEIVVRTASAEYTYLVKARRIVEPTEISVLAPTRQATITLISCYPYLLDTQRIVIIGTLKEH